MSGTGATDSAMTDRLVDTLSGHLRSVPPDVEWNTVRLPDLGLDSMSAIELVLTIEERFGVQFPDELLVRETFEYLSSLEAAVRSMLGERI
ncbi:phosphopantetheine-binding protein [Streptomyces sp. CB03238]|uniref:phosphopantetheine-binding protein n=1 Tax=Streptomyces sp. CB03238 TaxID=1907777 RepID=UPI0015C4B2AF|nr:phosphopantetheine-binding protein [Streptomyces sp. CB03238]